MANNDSLTLVKAIFESLNATDLDEKRRKELLENLQTAMANFSRAEMTESVGQFPLETLFKCLGDETEITCCILKDLMAISDPLKNLQKYHDFMLQGFQHPDAQVRALVLTQLLKCVDVGSPALKTLCDDHQDLLIAAAKEILSDDLGVAKQAGDFLVKLAGTDAGFDFLFGPAGNHTLLEMLRGEELTETLKFRIYETLALISKISKKHLEEVEDKVKLVEALSRSTFESNDPLEQMNALEILAILAETSYGLDRLEAYQVLSKVRQLGTNWKTDSLSGLLFPGLLKFVGKVGALRFPPDDLVTMVMDVILDGNGAKDVAVTTVAIEALAFIGSTPEGKSHLDKDNRLTSCFEKVREVLSSASSEFRCRVMEALSHLFGSDESNSACLPRWFALAFPQISVLFDLVQLPFPDIRLSALNFLASIAHLEWAQKHYLRSPGVIEFLTDRNVEPDKDCALAKFKIVSIILDSATPTTTKILSKENLARLRVHVRQGPFYAPAQSSVAFEGSS